MLIEKLKEVKELQEQNIKEKGGYGMTELPHLPEVLEYLKQYRAENNRESKQTVYNRELEEYITEKENIPQDLQDSLKTQVYFAQKDYRQEKEAEHKAKMLAEGWQELTQDTEYRGKIYLNTIVEGNWSTHEINDTAKIVDSVISVSDDGTRKTTIFIVAKGKRSRGWYLNNLKQAFYKVYAI